MLMKCAILVLMDNLQMRTSKKTMMYVTEMAVKDYCYQQCGENDCIWSESKCIDPVLKLYMNCPIMLLKNTDIPNGQANGLHCILH